MTESKLINYFQHHNLAVWLIAITLLVLGGYLSYVRFLDHEWISRAGCLIVVLGIWCSLGGLIQERVLLGRLKRRRRNAVARTRTALQRKYFSPEDIDQEISMMEDAFDKQAHELSQKLKVSMGVMEVSVLITGTLLWGFGDIAAALLFPSKV